MSPIESSGSVSTIPEDLAGSAKKNRDGAARHLANVIVWSFCISVAWLLLDSTYLLYKLMQEPHPAVVASAGQAAPRAYDFIGSAMLPFLKESASTVTSIFGSTLGFVLGYYFKNDSR